MYFSQGTNQRTKTDMSNYDAIVVGTGGVGSAALYELARRGMRVLGLDRFPAGHDRGSSHGQTRVIRQAYFEHPDYVPLLRVAYQKWAELEERVGRKLFHQVGLLEVGREDGLIIPGLLAAAREHDLSIDRLTPAEAEARFPGFHIPPDLQCVFEQQAGYLEVEACVQAHLAEAVRLGAELHVGPAVQRWSAQGSGVRVETERARYQADRLVITAGSWAGELLSDLQVPLRVLRKPVMWFANESRHYRREAGSPTFFFELPAGFFYGFPQLDCRGIKVSEHDGGELTGDPLLVDRQLREQDPQRVVKFLAECLPAATRQITHHEVCLYTMTPDEHFIVDRHPAFPQVCLTAGLSGHGFKFTNVLGQAMADLALDGKTELPVGFLGVDRPRLRPQQA